MPNGSTFENHGGSNKRSEGAVFYKTDYTIKVKLHGQEGNVRCDYK